MGGGVLCICWVRGRAIGKGIDFHDLGIRNGIDFHDFGTRNGIDFAIFAIGIGSGMHFRKIGIKSGISGESEKTWGVWWTVTPYLVIRLT